MKQNTISSVTRKIGFKPFIIVLLLLLFLIPIGLIKSLVRDRNHYFKEAAASILMPKGGEPNLEGIVLAVPYVETTETRNADGSLSYEEYTHYIVSVPESMKLNTTVEPEYLTRGIFEVPVFSCSVAAEGVFSALEFSRLRIQEDQLQWSDALLLLGISNKKNFTQSPLVTVDGKTLDMSLSAPYESSPFSNTVFYTLGESFARDGFSYKMDIALQGGNALSMTPVAVDNSFSVSSSWPTPGFSGGWLPAERHISEDGFDASWQIAGLSTRYPRTWLSTQQAASADVSESIEIGFVTPVDNYQKTERSVKYALLFLIIPFLAIFIFEVFTKTRIHPVQYGLIGLADVIFYLLLLSISEHLSFITTYWIASAAVSALMFLYAAAIFKKVRWGGFFAGVQAIAYIFLFGTLQAEDYALLIGSLGLFFVVGLLMVLTRKVDWYAGTVQDGENE